ncbi:hypothetical protein HHK36_014695 [Tetracentron sinense]|uniref:Uncharacterized protein n=1 Tax=Tetracentron sinense TaxID=13715 RepID=A0A834Z345_TETSI|nr:hypothetical protein HHK36_014695 [Tetracentron sinense]
MAFQSYVQVFASQDQSGGTSPNTIVTADNRTVSDVGSQSGDDHALKVRKPYTITKQRERWTEEEHKKFLEALKLYGRAWRRIEEHVGTKTAVQIRSHAQKFFSKVVRESSASNGGFEKPIEIPPPRPKRKPMHPYPRKLVHTLKKGISVPEQPERSPSPNLSASILENQSPTSVLSAVCSDTLASTTLNLHNSSLSPVSSAEGVNPASLLLSEQENGASSAEEENGSPSSILVTAGSFTGDQFPMMNMQKFDSDPKDNISTKEDSAVEAPTVTLKLFGRTVLVTDSQRPSSTVGTRKTLPSDIRQEKFDPQENEERPVQTLPWNPMQTELSVGSARSAWSNWPCGAPPLFYCMQLQKEDSKPVEAAPLPWWGGLPFPLLPTSMEMRPGSCLDKVHEEKEIHKEGSWMGSSTESISEVENGDKNWDVVESQSQEPSSDKEEKEPGPVSQLKTSVTSALFERRASPDKFMKGFVPYKRCLAERDTQSSAIVREERDGQRIRLCL